MAIQDSIPEEKVFIPGPTGKLEALLTLPQGTPVSNIGVICHPHPLHQGTMHNKVVTAVTRAWQQLGLATVRFNFRGVGESEGHYDKGIGEVVDLEAVLSFIRTKYPTAKIWLAGFSFGAFITLQVATKLQTDCAGLISIAPALSFFNFITLKTPACSWLVVQGEEDELVPKESVEAWYQELSKQRKDFYWEFVLLPHTSHFFHGRLVELKKNIQGFMQHCGF